MTGGAAAALAALPMYDLPGLRDATDAWWQGLARHLRAADVADVPDDLTRGLDLDALWTSADLLLAQACGYPLTHALAGRVRLVATPHYDCPDCEGADYRSLLLVRAGDPATELDDLRGRRVAINSRSSQSGCAALLGLVAPLAGERAFFSEVRVCGSHRESMRLVAAGAADLCAVDCVTHALLADLSEPAVARLRVLQRGPLAPGLPLITAGEAPDERVERLRAGLFAALDDPSLAAVRRPLRLRGAQVLGPEAYERILELERAAARLGYAELR